MIVRAVPGMLGMTDITFIMAEGLNVPSVKAVDSIKI
ncbi:hypothetical protein CLV51_104357 [Chitinophaga niastensis]|uniref:Uncharacterized protein n=1 Tax=Chitinophaga niastensis TaxID=536980 RepID=A0A2P8HHJ2_CHINA|nr:hypothetical protein CLV51_104357 [Chitinophaga niastensis]